MSKFTKFCNFKWKASKEDFFFDMWPKRFKILLVALILAIYLVALTAIGYIGKVKPNAIAPQKEVSQQITITLDGKTPLTGTITTKESYGPFGMLVRSAITPISAVAILLSYAAYVLFEELSYGIYLKKQEDEKEQKLFNVQIPDEPIYEDIPVSKAQPEETIETQENEIQTQEANE